MSNQSSAYIYEIGGDIKGILGDVKGGVVYQYIIAQKSKAEIHSQPLIPGSPYMGLKYFKSEDKDKFFGREQWIINLSNHLEANNLLFLVGASGSGKSSLVQAGLIPHLLDQWGAARVEQLTFVPDKNPFQSFYYALPRKDDEAAEIIEEKEPGALVQLVKNLKENSHKWLIFIDQFEELFTITPKLERDKFIASLVQLIKQQDNSVKLLMAMRSDFLDNLTRDYANLRDEVVNSKIQLVGELTEIELRWAIAEPAARNGVTFEERLVQQILDDFYQQAGSLPLLQYTLNLLWEEDKPSENNRVLNLDTYEDIDGVSGALQQQANSIYNEKLNNEEKKAAEKIFIELIDIAAKEPVSRRIEPSQFRDDPVIISTLNKLIDNRLLVSGRYQSTVEVAHEELLRSWGFIQNLIREKEEIILLKSRLISDAHQWYELRKEDEEKAKDELWSGSKLERVLEFIDEKALGSLDEESEQFIQASVERRDREKEERERRQLEKLEAQVALETEQEKNQILAKANQVLALANQKGKLRIRIGSAILAISLVGATIAGVMTVQAFQKRKELEVGRQIEETAVQIQQRFNLAELNNLLELMQGGRRLQGFVKDGRPLHEYPAISPILALQTSLTKIRERNQLNPPEKVLSVSYSPNYSPDKFLATGGDDGTIRIWKVSGQQIKSWNSSHGKVLGVSFSPTQQQLATVGSDGKIRFWNLSGEQLWEMKAHKGAATSVSFNPRNGQQLATGGQDGMVRLWSVSGDEQNAWKFYEPGESVRWTGGLPNGVSVSFSPDGQQLATAGPASDNREARETRVRLWDLFENPQLWDLSENPQREIRVNSTVLGLSFSPNGQHLITAQGRGEAVIFNLAGRVLDRYVSSSYGLVWDVNFSPDGQRFVATGLDGTARIWNVSKHLDKKKLKELSWQAYESGGVLWPQYPFSANGKHLATLKYDGKFRLWDLSEPGKSKLLRKFNEIVSFGFDPQKHRFVLGSKNGTVELWNLSDTDIGIQKLTNWSAHQGEVISVNFNSNGQHLFTWGKDKMFRLWNVSGNKKPQKLAEWSLGFTPWRATLSPDDQYIAAVGTTDGILRLWPLSKNQLVEKKLVQWKAHSGPTRSIAFSPNGKLLATAGDDNIAPAKLWDLSGKEQAQIIPSGQGRIEQVSFSPDGQLLATAGVDATARLWTLSGQQVAQFEVYRRNSGPWIRSVSFSPDGKFLAIGDEPYGRVHLLRIEKLDDLLEKGCEWLQEYLDSHPDASKVCPNR